MSEAALSDVGQYHWRQGTFFSISNVAANEAVAIKSGDGSVLAPPAPGRGGVFAVRVG